MFLFSSIFIQLLAGRYNHRDCRQFDLKLFALCLVMHFTSNVPIQSAESLFCLQVKRIYSHIDLKTFHDNTCHRVLPLLHNKLLRLLGYHTFRGTQFGRLSLPFKQLSGLMFPIPASLTHHLGQPQVRAFRFCRETDKMSLGILQNDLVVNKGNPQLVDVFFFIFLLWI